MSQFSNSHATRIHEALAKYDNCRRNAAGELIPAPRVTRGFTEDQILELATAISADRLRRKKSGFMIESPVAAREAIGHFFGNPEEEQFGMLWLDNKHSVIKEEVLFRGTIDGASVYPRVVVKHGLQCNAAAAVVIHNHPSGDPNPSEADKHITQRLQEALNLVDIRLLDHIIVGDEFYSFAENGLL